MSLSELENTIKIYFEYLSTYITNKLASLLGQIEDRKKELNSGFKKINCNCQEHLQRRTDLENELDSIYTKISSTIGEILEYLSRMLKIQINLAVEYHTNNCNTMLEYRLFGIRYKIEETTKKLNYFPDLKLEWEETSFSGNHESLSYICKVKIDDLGYNHRKTALWGRVKKSEALFALCDPIGIAIDNHKRMLYVVDRWKHCIKIFDKFRSTVREIRHHYITEPWGICISEDYLYITCNPANVVLRIENKNNYTRLIGITESITGITYNMDNETVLVCGSRTSTLLIFDKDLALKERIILNSYPESDWLMDVKCYLDQLYVLFGVSKYVVQCFTKRGEMIKGIVECGLIERALFFCIDSKNNFVISDHEANRIKIFSETGELLYTLGSDYDGTDSPGTLRGPSGICIDLLNRIVIVDAKNDNCLQAF